MTEYMSIGEMFDELLQQYSEICHEDDDYDYEAYEQMLETCSDEEFLAEYNRVFNND